MHSGASAASRHRFSNSQQHEGCHLRYAVSSVQIEKHAATRPLHQPRAQPVQRTASIQSLTSMISHYVFSHHFHSLPPLNLQSLTAGLQQQHYMLQAQWMCSCKGTCLEWPAKAGQILTSCRLARSQLPPCRLLCQQTHRQQGAGGAAPGGLRAVKVCDCRGAEVLQGRAGDGAFTACLGRRPRAGLTLVPGLARAL